MTANAAKRSVNQDHVPQLVRTALVPQNGVWVVGDMDQAPGPLQIPNLISMDGNDMLYLLVDIVLAGGSPPIEMRVEFSHTANLPMVAADWYPESALEPALLAAGIIRAGVAGLLYSFTASGKYRIPIVTDDIAARVAFQSNGAPGVDTAACTALRRIRDSLTS
jgi:hypothetical protein